MILAEEQDLVRRAQAGDREAVGELWDEFSPKLFGYLVNTLQNKPLAEDVFQSTWLKALEHLAEYKVRGSSIGAWLFAIARNECRQHWRRVVRDVGEPAEGEPSTDGRAGLHKKLLVEQILSDLSPDDQELLRLRYIADLTTREVAKVLAISAVAARVRLSRALKRAQVLVRQREQVYE